MNHNEILSGIPPPDDLADTMRLLPDTLLCYRIGDWGILVGPKIERLSKVYDILYHGYRLSVGIIHWEYCRNNASTIVSKLGDKTIIGFVP